MPEEAPEKKNETPEAAASAKSGGNPMIAVALVVVLVPVLSFAMMQMVFLPKMKQLITEASTQSKEKNPEESAPAHDAEEAPDKAHGEAAKQVYEFENIVANLSKSLNSRYIRVSFTLEGTDPQFTHLVEQNRVKLIDTTLGILSALDSQDIQKPGVKNIVRENLLDAFENALKKRIVQELYFSQFVVQ